MACHAWHPSQEDPLIHFHFAGVWSPDVGDEAQSLGDGLPFNGLERKGTSSIVGERYVLL
jgi:hypothetical protein